jgi:ubiquinone/menaquinone biosynthesis C-methylase UbiE
VLSKAHRDYFNSIAPQWNDKMSDDPVFYDYLKQFGISRGNRVLDVGAGTGRMTQCIVKLIGVEGQVVAEDIADRMLLEGKKRVKDANTFWVCDDIFSLAFKDEVFDKVLCFSAFPHFQDPLASLQEMSRVLVPSGKLLILHTCSSIHLNAFHAGLENPVNKDRLPQVKEILPLIKKAGLRPIRTIENESLYWVETVKSG